MYNHGGIDWTAPEQSDYTELGTDFVQRAVALVRSKRLPVVLVDRGKYYLAVNRLDLWGSKRRIAVRDLRALIEMATAKKLEEK